MINQRHISENEIVNNIDFTIFFTFSIIAVKARGTETIINTRHVSENNIINNKNFTIFFSFAIIAVKAR
jgi:hypothetical protein